MASLSCDDEIDNIINNIMISSMVSKPSTPSTALSHSTPKTSTNGIKMVNGQIQTIKPPKNYSPFIDICTECNNKCGCNLNNIIGTRYFCQGTYNGYPYWVNSNKIFMWSDKNETYYFGYSLGNNSFNVSVIEGFKYNGYHKYDSEINLKGGYNGFCHNEPNKKFHCKKCNVLFKVLVQDKYKIQLTFDNKMRVKQKGVNWLYLPCQVSNIPYNQRPQGWKSSVFEIKIENTYHEHNLGDGRGYPICCGGYYFFQGYTDNGYPYLVNSCGDYLWANDDGVYYFGYSIGRNDYKIAKRGGFAGNFDNTSNGFYCEHCRVGFKAYVAARGIP